VLQFLLASAYWDNLMVGRPTLRSQYRSSLGTEHEHKLVEDRSVVLTKVPTTLLRNNARPFLALPELSAVSPGIANVLLPDVFSGNSPPPPFAPVGLIFAKHGNVGLTTTTHQALASLPPPMRLLLSLFGNGKKLDVTPPQRNLGEVNRVVEVEDDSALEGITVGVTIALRWGNDDVTMTLR
jgi:hypothetical protein